MREGAERRYVHPSSPLSSALARHPHLCQTSRDAQGRRHPGFFCPRLSDPPEEAYCCRLQAAGGFCCAREEFEALHQVNLSALPPPPILRWASCGGGEGAACAHRLQQLEPDTLSCPAGARARS